MGTDLGYENLAKAVVARALEDIKDPPRRAVGDEARAWLLSESAEFWCVAAGYDYNSIRDKLRRVL